MKDEKTLFLMVGGFNTAFGFSAFVVIQFLWGKTIGYLGSLYAAHVVASIVAFILYRKIVFKVKGQWITDFVRFQGVYIVPLLANTIALPILVSYFHWNVYAAQASMVVVITVFSYLGHKFVSFRRKSE